MARRTQTVEPAPTPEALRFFCDLCRALERITAQPGPPASLRGIAEGHLHISAPDLTQRLQALEQALAVKGRPLRLIERSSGKSRPALTAEGRLLYAEAQRLLDAHASLASRLLPVPLEIRIATTNAILAHVLGGALATYLQHRTTLPRLVFEEHDYPKIVERVRGRQVAFGVGPHLPPSQYPDLHFRELFREEAGCVEMVLVCPPNHPFAEKRRAWVKLDELTTQRLFVLQSGLQPGLSQDLPPTDWSGGGSRVEMPSYTSILALVRMGLGVGLIPGWSWVLDDLCKQGLIYYVPVEPRLGPIGLSLYLHKDAELHPQVADLVEAIVQHVPRLRLPGTHERKPPSGVFPATLEDYRYLYHVSCVAAGCAYPEWRQSRLRWSEWKRGDVGARLEDLDVPGEYTIRGVLADRFLCWTAAGWTRPKQRKVRDRFMAAFNGWAGTGQALVGTWTGFDDDRSPVSGPMILAPEPVPLDQLKEISLRAQPYIFINAEQAHEQKA